MDMLTGMYDYRVDTERLDARDGRGGASHLLEAPLLYASIIVIVPILYMMAD